MRFNSRNWQKVYAILVILACLLVAGPELGIAFELIALVDVLGIELLIFCFTAPLWVFWYQVKSWCFRFDPYFFMPSPEQILVCPGLLAHAVPGDMGWYLDRKDRCMKEVRHIRWKCRIRSLILRAIGGEPPDDGECAERDMRFISTDH